MVPPRPTSQHRSVSPGKGLFILDQSQGYSRRQPHQRQYQQQQQYGATGQAMGRPMEREEYGSPASEEERYLSPGTRAAALWGDDGGEAEGRCMKRCIRR